MINLVISINHLHLTNWEPKYNFEERRKKRNPIVNMDLSLSLSPNSNTNLWFHFHIYIWSAMNSNYQFWLWLYCYKFAKWKINYMVPSFPNFKMHYKLFQMEKPIWWLDCKFHKLSNHIKFINFWVHLIPQINSTNSVYKTEI